MCVIIILCLVHYKTQILCMYRNTCQVRVGAFHQVSQAKIWLDKLDRTQGTKTDGLESKYQIPHHNHHTEMLKFSNVGEYLSLLVCI